jgi:hypothetical protein
MRVGKALHKDSKCPFCDYVMDRVSVVDAKTQLPEDGDIGLCLHCLEWMIFDSRLEHMTRKPTTEEYEEIVADPVTTALLRAAWLTKGTSD